MYANLSAKSKLFIPLIYFATQRALCVLLPFQQLREQQGHIVYTVWFHLSFLSEPFLKPLYRQLVSLLRCEYYLYPIRWHA